MGKSGPENRSLAHNPLASVRFRYRLRDFCAALGKMHVLDHCAMFLDKHHAQSVDRIKRAEQDAFALYGTFQIVDRVSNMTLVAKRWGNR